MPDAEGKLTEDEMSKLKAWMQRFAATDQPCPVCLTRGWTVIPHLVQPLTLGGQGSVQLGGIGYPNVGLVCNTCGNTRLLNAVAIGLLPSADSKDER